MSSLSEDELVEEILQRAWDDLLKARAEGKIPTFDSAIPAQLAQWLDEVYNSQLGTLRATDQEMWKNKMFAIAVAYRISIQTTIGMDYFMKEMSDTNKMKAIDNFVGKLEDGINKENKVKRSLR